MLLPRLSPTSFATMEHEQLLHGQSGDLRHWKPAVFPSTDRALPLHAKALAKLFLSQAEAEPDVPKLPPCQTGLE